MAKKLRCMLSGHRWLRQTADGEVFQECRVCKERNYGGGAKSPSAAGGTGLPAGGPSPGATG